MTKAAAIYQFWSSFNLTAYEENEVPTGDDKPAFPYLTYEFATDGWMGVIPLSASLWYRSESWKAANAKAEEISAYIGLGGVFLKCDGGYIHIRRGSPFAQNMGDTSNDLIKRKYINVIAEFLTAN